MSSSGTLGYLSNYSALETPHIILSPCINTYVKKKKKIDLMI